jgi:hypothetical protein
MTILRTDKNTVKAVDQQGNRLRVTVNGKQLVLDSYRIDDSFGITQYVDGVDVSMLLDCLRKLAEPWEGK